jgi:glutathione S-transferase
MEKYRGQNLYEAIFVDIFAKTIVPMIFCKPEEKEAKMEIAAADYAKACGHISRVLSQREDKFICGNKLTLHDFTVGGIFLNLVVNPNNRDPEFWSK